MWICFNDAFLSIVKDLNNDDNLLVRARDVESIPKLFGKDVEVLRGAGTDYLYRASIKKEIVAKVIHDHVCDIDYGNFKASVKDSDYSYAYSTFWYYMYNLQEKKEQAIRTDKDWLKELDKMQYYGLR